ncbi:MAG: hypothetical protein V2J07_03090 [Anaerolineae bacterium]|nr:hypothetical protein [Anaerolineae bacterium]
MIEIIHPLHNEGAKIRTDAHRRCPIPGNYSTTKGNDREILCGTA